MLLVAAKAYISWRKLITKKKNPAIVLARNA